MNALMYATPARQAAPAPNRYDDPLDEDTLADPSVVTTRRGLTRLALIASETGARFQREGDGRDPMHWLLAPRRLFGGGSAIDAVLGRDDFLRALLLHGLSIGLDADPVFIDGLISDEDDRGDDGRDDDIDRDGEVDGADDGHDEERDRGDGTSDGRSAERGGWCARPRDVSAARCAALGEGEGPRLVTATLVHHDGRTTLHAFHASVCADPLEAYERIASRYGADAARDAELSIGFDPTTTFAEALVSPAMCELLELVDAEPGGTLAAGLDLNLEQRFDT